MRKKGILMVDLNQMFEAQMQWVYDDGFFYITGRDVIAVIMGFFIGAVFVLTWLCIKYHFEERK